jgi:hypothetical protein
MGMLPNYGALERKTQMITWLSQDWYGIPLWQAIGWFTIIGGSFGYWIVAARQ